MLSILLNLIINFALPQPIITQNYLPVYNQAGQVEQTVYFGPERSQDSTSLGPKLTADSALVIDKNTNTILLAKDPEKLHPIASLTKLMTAIVFLEHNPGWDQTIEYTVDDNVGGASLWLEYGDQATVTDLYRAMLVGSKNNAVMMLVKSTGMSVDQFVAKMNEKAAALGLQQTSFADPTGLSEYNQSSATDYVKIMNQVFQQPQITEVLTAQTHQMETVNTKRQLTVKNTNRLLKSYLNLKGGKTGYTYEAGYCLAVETEAGIYIIVPGAADADARFQEVKALATWTETNYNE